MKKLASFIGAAALALCIPSLGWAQADYPSRPITLVVPFPPGGVTDVVARELARSLTKSLNQTVLVENRAGAAGNIGTRHLARTAPDGYTLGVLAISSMTIAPHVTRNLGFSPTADFTPITNLVTTPGAIVANANAPYNSLQELIAQARQSPGKIGYATPGNGSSPHLTAEMMSQQANIKLVHVPYKGGGPALQDLLANHIGVSFEASLVSTITHVSAGRLKVLAMTGPTRSPLLPNVPTVAETGFPGFNAQSWFGFFGPAGLPPRIVEMLNKAATEALRDREIIDRFEKLGANPAPGTPAEFREFLSVEDKRWSAVARSLNLQMD
jgi:tripartite-type tricarboxylate transporter receptor subunit TctC